MYLSVLILTNLRFFLYFQNVFLLKLVFFSPFPFLLHLDVHPLYIDTVMSAMIKEIVCIEFFFHGGPKEMQESGRGFCHIS